MKELEIDELYKVDGGVDIGVVGLGLVGVIGGIVGIAVPEPATTAGGIIAVGAGVTTIIAGIVD